MKHPVLLAAAFAPVLLLVACGGEPSDADIMAALQADAAKGNAAAQAMLGRAAPEEMQTKVLAAKKVACAEDKPGWKCTVAVSVQVPIFGKQDSTASFNFVKGDKGWVVTQ
jgi:hypothetical protein